MEGCQEEENETSSDQGQEKSGHSLDVPKGLTRSLSLLDTKLALRKKDVILASASETDLRRYFLSPAVIRSISVNEYPSDGPRSPVTSRGNYSDDEVFEFPHARSPISLKVYYLCS